MHPDGHRQSRLSSSTGNRRVAEMRSQIGLLILRFIAALLLASAALTLFAALDRSVLAPLNLTLFVVPAAVLVGFLPLLFWYGRDAYPIGLVFVPAAYYWLRVLASATSLTA